MIIHPPAIEADSQLQERLCPQGLRASVAQRIHSEGYLALGLKVLAFGVGREVDARCCSTVFFQDHA